LGGVLQGDRLNTDEVVVAVPTSVGVDGELDRTCGRDIDVVGDSLEHGLLLRISNTEENLGRTEGSQIGGRVIILPVDLADLTTRASGGLGRAGDENGRRGRSGEREDSECRSEHFQMKICLNEKGVCSKAKEWMCFRATSVGAMYATEQLGEEEEEEEQEGEL